MADLNLTLFDFAAEVGDFLGWGRGADHGDKAWDERKKQKIDAIVASGQRRFYYPEPLPGQTVSHRWSFLQPVATVTLASGEQTAKFPDDYGAAEGQATISGSSSSSYLPVHFVNDGFIRAKYAELPDATGHPQFVAEEVLKGTTHDRGQKKRLLVWPAADADYTIQFRYYINPQRLQTAQPYCYGGPQHVETILESCLAVAESRMDDTQSVHAQLFVQRLAASISIDSRNKPQALGYNADRSDVVGNGRPSWHGWGDGATFNGVQPS